MKALRRKPGGLSFYDYPQARGQAPGGMRSQEAPGLRRDAFSPMRESVQRECLGGGPRFAAGHQGRVRRSQGRLPLRTPVFSGHAAFKSAQTVRRAMLSHAFSPISAAAPFAGTEKERRPPPRLISNFIEAMGGGRRFFVPPREAGPVRAGARSALNPSAWMSRNASFAFKRRALRSPGILKGGGPVSESAPLALEANRAAPLKRSLWALSLTGEKVPRRRLLR